MAVDDIRQLLHAEREAHKGQISELELKVEQTKSKLKQIEKALSALSDKQLTPKTTRSPSKPAATKAEVIELLKETLRGGQTMGKQRLRQVVEEHISNIGKSRSGLALRFSEALKAEQFTSSAQGYCLLEDASNPSS